MCVCIIRIDGGNKFPLLGQMIKKKKNVIWQWWTKAPNVHASALSTSVSVYRSPQMPQAPPGLPCTFNLN